MTERPIEDELRELAEQVAAGPDDVADMGADAAAVYRRERMAPRSHGNARWRR